MRFQLLGGLSVIDGDRPVDLSTPKQRAVLAILLLELDRVVSVDRLIELLWDDQNDKAVSSLQAYVSRLRSALEPERRPRDPATILVSQAPGYRLVVDRAQVDVYEFEDEVRRGRDQLRDDPAGAAATLDGALALWTGPLLPELASELFVIAAADRCEALRLGALEGAAEARLALGEHDRAASLLEAEAARHPARERLQGLLALALYRGGRQADALRVVDQCRRALVDAAGLDIGAELRALEADLLAQAPSLDWHPGPSKPAPAAPAAAAGPRRPVVVPDLVGRAHELDVIDAALETAVLGEGGLVVVVGEPGIGKTRLAEAAVEIAGSRGAITAWARCPESRSTPPFWALTQLGEQLRAGGLEDLDIAALDVQAPDSEVVERFGLYRAVVEQIRAAGRPLLLVIDDLQWADPDTLRLIEHVAAEVRSTSTVLLATARPLGEDPPEALVDCLAEMARVPGCAQLALTGLEAEAVAQWLDARSDLVVAREVAELVHDRTGGNPLFIRELVELLATEGLLDDPEAARSARVIPLGVQFVVRRRVSRLPGPSQHLLTTAAVIGSTFSAGTLASVASIDVGAVLEDLEPALEAGLLVAAGGELAFSHALVADALAGEVNAARRAAIHAAAARTLAEVAGPTFGMTAAAIAHHALEGMLAGTGELAIEASTRAARLAAARFAHEDAAAHWRDVAHALERCRPSDLPALIDALIEQADALTIADQVAAAKAPILRAVEIAETIGRVDEMARAAALVNFTHVWTNEPYGIVDARIVHALERTLDRLGDGEENRTTRAVLLGALASELVFAERDRHHAVCRAAEEAARATGVPVVLARVLNNIMLPGRAEHHDVRRERSLEILAIGDEHGLPIDLRFAGHHHLAECLLEVADFDQARREIERARRVVESDPAARLLGQHLWFEANLATTTGRYEEAGELTAEAHELLRRGRQYDVDTLLLAGLAAIAIDHGGLDDLLPFVLATTESSSFERALGEAMGVAMLELGRVDLAISLTTPFGPEERFPDDWTTLFTAAAALHVRVELGDAVGAAAAASILVDYPHRWASAGTSPISMGPVCLALARYSELTGEDDEASRHYDDAVRISEQGGAVAWLARSLVHQSVFLGRVGEGAGAAAARGKASELAQTYGLPYVQRRLEASGTVATTDK